MVVEMGIWGESEVALGRFNEGVEMDVREKGEGEIEESEDS